MHYSNNKIAIKGLDCRSCRQLYALSEQRSQHRGLAIQFTGVLLAYHQMNVLEELFGLTYRNESNAFNTQAALQLTESYLLLC